MESDWQQAGGYLGKAILLIRSVHLPEKATWTNDAKNVPDFNTYSSEKGALKTSQGSQWIFHLKAMVGMFLKDVNMFAK